MVSLITNLSCFLFVLATLTDDVEAKLGSNGTSRLGPILYIYAGVLAGVPVLCCLCVCVCVCCRARGSRKNRELIDQQNNLSRNYPGGPPVTGRNDIAMQNVVYGGGVGGVSPGYGQDNGYDNNQYEPDQL